MWSIENSADRFDPLRDRLDPHRAVDEYTDAAGRSFVNRTGDRPGDLASDRLHHRGSQARTPRFLDLIRTDAGVIRHGAVLREGHVFTMGDRCLHQPHLVSRAHLAGAAVCARITRLARLEGPLRGCQEVSGMVNLVWLLNGKTPIVSRTVKLT